MKFAALVAIFISSQQTSPALFNGQLKGTGTNDNASSGNVGEMQGPITRARASATSLTSGSNPVNVATTTSVTLTPGDWSCQAMVGFETGTSTSITSMTAAISATSSTMPNIATTAIPTSGEVTTALNLGATVPANTSDIVLVIPPYRVTVASASTLPLFLVAQATFTVSTLSVYGSMECRRMR